MIAFFIRHSLAALLLALALLAAGLVGWQRVPVDAIPDLSDNQVIVWAEWPGKSPEDVDQQLTRQLGLGLQGLPGVVTVRGMSLYGAGYVYVIFQERRDLYECRTRVLERLAQIQSRLPAGVAARLGPDATAMGQVFAFTLQGPADIELRRRTLDQLVVPALQAVPGVAEVAPAGGAVREYQVELDPDRLRALGLGVDEVMMALGRAGRDVGAMSVERSGVETMVRGIGFIRSPAEVEGVVLRGDPARGAGLRLGDVARVQVGGAVRQGLLADAGGEQVGAVVAMRVREDPAAVIAALKRRLADLAPALARDGLVAVPFYDRSQLIHETRATLTATLTEELVTTVLVVVLFLLHLRASVAVAAALPLGVLLTFAVMHLLGVGANLMSLAGIAISIGVMVDFSIVMTENITQHLVALRERRGGTAGWSPTDPQVVQAVVDGAREVAPALLTAAGTTVIGFLPIFALDDQAGRLFHPLALTKTLAIGGAVVAGMLIVPALCRWLLPPWRLPRGAALAAAGLAAGLVGGWFLPAGASLDLAHGRWAVTVPGWLLAPPMALLAGLAVWRLGGERLVSYEENPVSHAIHRAYDWAYHRIVRHRLAFVAVMAVLALGGWTLALGWHAMSAPLRTAAGWLGADLTELRADAALARWLPGLGSSFLPPLDEGALLFMPSLPASAGLGETQRVMMEQNRRILAVPEVAGLMGKMGRAETALDPAPIGMIETVVVLKPYREWPVHESDGGHRPRTLAEVRAALAAASDIPGVAPSWLQPIETRVVMLSTGIRSLIALQILGDDPAELERFAVEAERVVRGVPGAADVQAQREGGKPYAELRLDHQRLAAFGLNPEQVMQAVESALGGMPLWWSLEGNQRYGVRLRLSRELRDDGERMGALPVPLPGGGSVPLRSLAAAPVVHLLGFHGTTPEEWRRTLPLAQARALTVLSPQRAELVLPAGQDLPAGVDDGGAVRSLGRRAADDPFTYVVGPMAIRSEGARRTQYVLLNVRGAGEVQVVEEADRRLRAALAAGEVHLPQGATWRWVGRYEQKLKADATMAWVVAAAMLVMVVLIRIGTRSTLTTAIIIGCNVTVTTAGGWFLVWLAGAEMTTAVAVGFLVLLGVMFNDGILLGTYIHQAFLVPPATIAEAHQRVFAAGLRRRRPALMTNLTTLLSLIPVLWSDGRGAEVMRPMVLPIIGGMVFDLISLFSVPVLYAWWWEWKLGRRPPPSAA